MTDMREVKLACDEMEAAIDACAKACAAAGAYMPGFATRLRVIADHYADEFPDDINGGRHADGSRDAARAACDSMRAERDALAAQLAEAEALVRALRAMTMNGADTIATVMLLDIADALKVRDRVFLTRDETSLGPRILEFAAALAKKEGGGGELEGLMNSFNPANP